MNTVPAPRDEGNGDQEGEGESEEDSAKQSISAREKLEYPPDSRVAASEMLGRSYTHVSIHETTTSPLTIPQRLNVSSFLPQSILSVSAVSEAVPMTNRIHPMVIGT